MANTGTYGAYKTQPEVKEGFAGEQQLMRIAAMNFKRKAEEREDQRKAVEAGNKAIENALEAGNVDTSQIDSSIHGIVFRLLDDYKENLATLNNKISEDPSPKNQLELKKAQMDFEGKLNTLKGIGTKINTINANRNKFDNVVGIEALNGVTEFVLSVPKWADKVDVKTLSVDGKGIGAMFNEMVDVSKLVPNIDADGVFGDWIAKNVKEGVATKQLDPSGQFMVYERTDSFDETGKRPEFKSTFEGSAELDKQKKMMLRMRMGMDADQLAKYDDQYVSFDEKGLPYISTDNVFDYKRDTQITPNLHKVQKINEYIPQTPQSTSTYDKRQAEEDNLDIDRVNKIDRIVSGNGDADVSSFAMTVGGNSVQVQKAGYVYNPNTGEQEFKIDYMDNGEKGSQSWKSKNVPYMLANMMYGGKLDYDKVKSLNPQAVSPTKEYKMTTAARSVSIAEDQNNKATALSSSVFSPAVVKGVYDEDKVIKNTKELVSTSNSPSLQKFFNDEKLFYTSTDGKESITLGDTSYNLADAKQVDMLQKKMARLSTLAVQLKTLGHDESYIDEELKKAANSDKYDIDPVVRAINQRYNDEGDRQEALIKADRMILEGKQDKEIISVISEKLVTEEDKAYQMLIDGYKNMGDNEETANAKAEAFIEKNMSANKGASRESILKAYYKQINTK